MKISSKGRYALRLMIDLAVNNTGEYITIKSIARRQDISEKYLEQIISLLSRAGFVKSTRGSQGGYKLARDPRGYTVGEILRLTEGSLAPVQCLEEESDDCDRSQTCVTFEVWGKLYDAILGVVDNISLYDLAEKQMEIVCNNYQI